MDGCEVHFWCELVESHARSSDAPPTVSNSSPPPDPIHPPPAFQRCDPSTLIDRREGVSRTQILEPNRVVDGTKVLRKLI
jgi:hypothetical protein